MTKKVATLDKQITDSLKEIKTKPKKLWQPKKLDVLKRVDGSVFSLESDKDFIDLAVGDKTILGFYLWNAKAKKEALENLAAVEGLVNRMRYYVEEYTPDGDKEI